MTDISTDAFDRLSEGLRDFRAILQDLRDMLTATMNPVVTAIASPDIPIDHSEQMQEITSAEIATPSTLYVLESHVVKLATLQTNKQRSKNHRKNEPEKQKAVKLKPWGRKDPNRIKHPRMTKDVEKLDFHKTQYPRLDWLDPIPHRKLQGRSQINDNPQVLLSPGSRRKLNILA